MSGKMIALISLIGLMAPAVAQDSAPFYDGNSFIRGCQTAKWELACAGYTLGVAHGYNGDGPKRYCKPQGVDTGQMFQIGLAYIRANPERSHHAAFSLLIESWIKAFPCPSK